MSTIEEKYMMKKAFVYCWWDTTVPGAGILGSNVAVPRQVICMNLTLCSNTTSEKFSCKSSRAQVCIVFLAV